MLTEGSEHLVNLDKFESYHSKAAYLTIVLGAERAGYVSRPGSKGSIRHTSFYTGRTNPFALIANQKHLLFYIRQPALGKRPELALAATRLFNGDVLAKTNSKEEIRIRIRDNEHAAKLVSWLFTTP